MGIQQIKVEYRDHMGSDLKIVNSARVSFGKYKEVFTEEDANLIDFLVREFHTSPLEMGSITFFMRLPIFVARQAVRHRTASLNEISGRYVNLDTYSEPGDRWYHPDAWRGQAKNVKQGSSGPLAQAEQDVATVLYEQSCTRSFDTYRDLLELGVASEQARICLPLSTMTEWVWEMDVHNLAHFLRLRLAPDAQYEIRVLAEKMLEIYREYFPETVKAVEEWVINGVRFGRSEVKWLHGLINVIPEDILEAQLSTLTERQKRILFPKIGKVWKS